MSYDRTPDHRTLSDARHMATGDALVSIPVRVRGTDVVTCRLDPEGAEGGPPVEPEPLKRHQLLIQWGDEVRPYPLPDRGQAVVGRAADADIRIDSAAVSRKHARVFVEDDNVQVIDLGSQNGTRVNGERLMGKRALSGGDIVTFADVTAVVDSRRLLPNPAPDAAPPPQIAPRQVLELGDRTVVVADPVMAHVYTQLARLAPTELSVLILGETGTGKELAATALRIWSKRRNRPLISINCAALPEGLVESELFGFERGAFSGANSSKPGLLEAADGGTILLDEIGDLPLQVQAKILRVIESRRLTRLGSVREQTIDVRIIAATHRDLEAGVKAGWFRADLYYRLSVAIVRIPPLRMRPRELPLLARRFIQDACRETGRPPLTLEDDAIACLLGHDWPGNVRELKNLIDYVVVAATGSVITAELVAERIADGGTGAGASGSSKSGFSPSGFSPTASSANATNSAPVASVGGSSRAEEIRGDNGPPGGSSALTGPVRPLAEANRAFERRTIEAALLETGGNKTRAAKRLGVPLRTFMDKIKRYGL